MLRAQTEVPIVALLRVKPLKVAQERRAFLVVQKVVQAEKAGDSLVANAIKITQQEADNFYHASNILYDMYVAAAEYVIENNLFFELGVPFNLTDAIKKSWESDVHWHIYGAFTLSGGYDGMPIKLLGFEADTPQALLQTAMEQKEENQFNEIYEKIVLNFKRLITLDDGVELFDARYDGWKILFSAPSDDEERIQTAHFLQACAEDAGFETSFSYLHEVHFGDDGISDAEGISYEYWCKNYAWLDMAIDESELATTITNIMKNQQAIIINPAYTLLFESRGMLAILNKLYPDSPYLLESSFTPFDGSVPRKMYGEDATLSNFKDIYVASNNDALNARVYFAYEGCGLSFMSRDQDFIEHFIV